MSDDEEYDEYAIEWIGECTCEHEPDEHGWGDCRQDSCECEAGWYE